MKKELFKLLRVSLLFLMLFAVKTSYGQNVSENNITIKVGDEKEIGFNMPDGYEFSHFSIEGNPDVVSNVKVIDSSQAKTSGLRNLWKKVVSFLGLKKGSSAIIIYIKPKGEGDVNINIDNITININVVEEKEPEG